MVINSGILFSRDFIFSPVDVIGSHQKCSVTETNCIKY